MKKVILLAIVASLSANTASALEIVGGRLVNHKETIPANVIASFQATKPSDNFMKLIQKLSALDEVTISNIAYPNGGYMGDAIQIRGASYVHIKNNEDVTHSYLVHTMACSDPTAQAECVNVEDTLEVDAHGEVLLPMMLSITHRYKSSGLFSSVFYTTVTRDHQPAFSSIANNYIDIGEKS